MLVNHFVATSSLTAPFGAVISRDRRVEAGRMVPALPALKGGRFTALAQRGRHSHLAQRNARRDVIVVVCCWLFVVSVGRTFTFVVACWWFSVGKLFIAYITLH